ncbi:hypothetical protein [Methylobacterium sp. A54F]
MTLSNLRRPLLVVGSLLVLANLLLLVACALPAANEPQLILPRDSGLISAVGLALVMLAQGIAAAARRGWRRLLPLLAPVPAVLAAVLLLGLGEVFLARWEVGRVTLRDGRVVLMTLEPGLSDTMFALWQPEGLRWRTFLAAARDVTYSEDHAFTESPALVLAPDGRHLLIRRGGIWTDCWRIEKAVPQPCLPEGAGAPRERSAWLDRSDRITAEVGTAP